MSDYTVKPYASLEIEVFKKTITIDADEIPKTIDDIKNLDYYYNNDVNPPKGGYKDLQDFIQGLGVTLPDMPEFIQNVEFSATNIVFSPKNSHYAFKMKMEPNDGKSLIPDIGLPIQVKSVKLGLDLSKKAENNNPT